MTRKTTNVTLSALLALLALTFAIAGLPRTASAGLQTALADANTTIACLHMAPSGADLIVSGCNLHIQSGGGATAAINGGLGNLIIGYSEELNGLEQRTGSHNLVIGEGHTYTSYGGLVAGYRNRGTGQHASVTGGSDNTASGSLASVTGGFLNTASGSLASVSGGSGRTAIGNSNWAAGSLVELF